MAQVHTSCAGLQEQQGGLFFCRIPFLTSFLTPVLIQFPLLTYSLCLCRSKLSSVCWNSYVKSNLICSDYEGVVQLWDVGQQTETMTFEEHAKRVWSVDFSHVSSQADAVCVTPCCNQQHGCVVSH